MRDVRAAAAQDGGGGEGRREKEGRARRSLAGLRIGGGAVRQDGRGASLTAPNGPAQQLLLRAAAHGSGVPPASCRWYESHGTGTRLGDPMEAGSFASVLGGSRGDAMPSGLPLLVGSLKATTAHTEGAAGLPGLRARCSS